MIDAPESKSKIHKAPWGTGLRICEDLWRLRLRHPDPSGRARIIVNTYVYAGANTLAVIDPGWPGTLEGLGQALAELGLARDFGDVDYWLYTHAHIDHMGAAALLEQRSDAPHIAATSLSAYRSKWHHFQDSLDDWGPWIREAFAAPQRERLLRARRKHSLVQRFGPAALTRTEFIDFGEHIQIGELNLEFIDARGHDPHHGAFFERKRGWLFSGDVILAVPTPICRAMGDDLGAYRQSVERLAALPSTLFLPGHGLHRHRTAAFPLEILFDRSREFVHEFERTTRRILAEAERPIDLFELAIRSTPGGEALLPDTRWWVHMALIDSHLAELVDRGDVTRTGATLGPLYHL